VSTNIAKDLVGLSAPLKSLKRAERNPRKGDVEAIKKSYERFGQRKPIIAHRKTKIIIAGNHQYQAAKDLGWDQIAVVWVDDNDETATAYSIADNRIGQLGEWDVQELVSAFEELDPSDLEVIGFSEIDIEDYRALLDEQVGFAPAMLMDGGQGERTSKKDGNPDTQVEKTNTYDEFLERYASRAVRAIMLYYPNDVYKEMTEDLGKLAEIMGVEDTASVVEKLVKERLLDE
jgi:ParB-like chromosome segregation protein Spo0J